MYSTEIMITNTSDITGIELSSLQKPQVLYPLGRVARKKIDNLLSK